MAKLNPREIWDGLDETQRRAIGEAAILLEVASTFNGAPEFENADPALIKWGHAEATAWLALAYAAYLDPADYVEGPDLAPFGIIACRICGCTTAHACPGGCSWVEPDLCSACVPGGAR